MFGRLFRLFTPFQSIAEDLHVMRELYEKELSERVPPIIRITQTPRSDDTIVEYMGAEKPKSKLRDLMDGLTNNLSEEDEDEPIGTDTD